MSPKGFASSSILSKGRTATDIPVPVDVVGANEMKQTGATEVGRALQALVPSFNFSSSSVSDGTDALRPATLRGLGPDQVLVLVNGKRRHNSALIHVNTSVGRGTAGVDMNAIPASAIKRIEVLRDGAAAQYGSDAIAGVINIVLKDHSHDGIMEASYGEMKDGDGETVVYSINKGLGIGESGFFNVTAEYRDRGRTNRSGLDGTQQYPLQDDGSFDPREFTIKRKTFRVGDADSEQKSLVANASFPLRDNTWLYSFLSYSDRQNVSAGFYRTANDDRNPANSNTGAPQYPDGFLPLINTDIDDISLAIGLETTLADWDLDAGLQTGRNRFGFTISESLNASHVEAFGFSPSKADAGELELGLSTINVDLVREYTEYTIALGAEYREDRYQLKSGDPLSYLDYAPAGTAPAGIQVFPGYKPVNEVDEQREAIGFYGDIEFYFSDALMFSTALRYEDYNDFGDTFNGKLALRYDFNPTLTLRTSSSTGFRAPSMQQLYFNNVSTQFTGPNATPRERGTFRNDSALAKELGIPTLREEESLSFAFGFVITPIDDLVMTLDYYRIDIDDRIVISGSVSQGLDPVLDAALESVGAGEAQFFLNAANTETEGVELVVTYNIDFAGGQWHLSGSANHTETKIVELIAPVGVAGIPGIGGALFTEQDISIVEEWQPKDRINLTSSYIRNNWRLSVLVNRYGEYTVRDNCSAGNDCLSQTLEAEWVTDVQVSYAFNNGLAVKIGGNNVFDARPDKNESGQSRFSPSGGLVDPVTGEFVVNSTGVFTYSRRSAPFGFNGAYYYAGISYEF